MRPVPELLAGILLLLAAPAPQASPAPVSPAPVSPAPVSGSTPTRGVLAASLDPLVQLERWVSRAEMRRKELEPGDLQALRTVLGQLSPQLEGEDEARERTLGLLARATAASWEHGSALNLQRALAGREALSICRSAFTRAAREDLVHWMATSFLVSREADPRIRTGAALLLEGSRSDEVLMGLLVQTRDQDERPQAAALNSLAGWDAETVHARFITELEQWGELLERPSAQLAEEHFSTVELDAASRTSPKLASWVSAHLLNDDWRLASRAIKISSALDDPLAVPALIESLEGWKTRHEAGLPVRRVTYDIVRELQARSGLAITDHPQRWRTWWRAVEARGGDPGEINEGRGDGQATRAGFFGLSPMTDRVIFVIDRSGSMRAPFGFSRSTASRAPSRYQEAIAQMLAYLGGLGESAKFTVVLFDDDARSWRKRLVPATSGNLRSASAWLRGQRPDGGTNLHSGFDLALNIDSRGDIDLRTLEADTVIVLCDGATESGSAWVEPTLERVGKIARVVFHCVQIGDGGDGTLEALAEHSGGQFVSIEP